MEYFEAPDRIAVAEGTRMILPTVQSALNNAISYSQIPLRNVLRVFGGAAGRVASDSLLRNALITMSCIALLASLFLIKEDFEIRVEGELRPRVERHIFAPARWNC